jgi:hypothetical protein
MFTSLAYGAPVGGPRPRTNELRTRLVRTHDGAIQVFTPPLPEPAAVTRLRSCRCAVHVHRTNIRLLVH